MLLEPKVGEIFELDGKKYKCVEDNDKYCTDCCFKVLDYHCRNLQCDSFIRDDNNSVSFKLVTDELG